MFNEMLAMSSGEGGGIDTSVLIGKSILGGPHTGSYSGSVLNSGTESILANVVGVNSVRIYYDYSIYVYGYVGDTKTQIAEATTYNSYVDVDVSNYERISFNRKTGNNTRVQDVIVLS